MSKQQEKAEFDQAAAEFGFLPEDYSVPKSNSFMKFQPGVNTFRVLSPAVTGWEYWTTENKPIRSRTPFADVPADIKTDAEGKFSIKHFWVLAVWNYLDKEIQTLTITQSGIQKEIKDLAQNPKWGNPVKYDITIKKEGQGLTTKYKVTPEPHSTLPAEITEAYAKKNMNLESIFDNK